MNVKVVTHYGKDDPRFFSDYASIDIFVGGKLAKQYGDYYHDKGQERMEAFIEGLEFALDETIKVTYERVADSDDY